MWIRFFLFFLLLFSSSYAIWTGNPMEPGLMLQGVWKKKPSWFSIRIGYFDDWVYNQRFRDEFEFENEEHTQTCLQLSTHSGIVTLNFKDRIDFYGLIGSSSMQLDEGIYTKQALSWGAGGKLILFKYDHFFIGTDFKYFETVQEPKFFVIDHLAYNIITDYKLKYEEFQGSLGIAYRWSNFSPYVNATYLHSRIDPMPALVFVRFPDIDELADVIMKSIISKKKWGMTVGFSLVDCSKASLSFEWRVFNQNAINVLGEVRF